MPNMSLKKHEMPAQAPDASLCNDLDCRTEENAPDDRLLYITFPIHTSAPYFTWVP